uniref:Uncharacterized protein n=1 Tax=Amphimedon queenslandica TaxID=400682 RepID=A0A1X7VBF1_AMPQE
MWSEDDFWIVQPGITRDDDPFADIDEQDGTDSYIQQEKEFCRIENTRSTVAEVGSIRSAISNVAHQLGTSAFNTFRVEGFCKDGRKNLIDLLKEANITNGIAGFGGTHYSGTAQSQPGSQPAKYNLEEQHTPTSKNQKECSSSVVIGYKSRQRTYVPTPSYGKIVHLVWMLNIEKSLCHNFSDTDETEPDSVTFHDSVVQAELLYKSSIDVVFDSIENDLFDDVDNAIVIDCLTVYAAEETELMETRNGDKTDNLILVRCDYEVMSKAKWNGFKLCGNIIDKIVKPRNMTK